MDLGEKGGAGREWAEGEAAKAFAFLFYPLSLSLPPFYPPPFSSPSLLAVFGLNTPCSPKLRGSSCKSPAPFSRSWPKTAVCGVSLFPTLFCVGFRSFSPKTLSYGSSLGHRITRIPELVPCWSSCAPMAPLLAKVGCLYLIYATDIQ